MKILENNGAVLRWLAGDLVDRRCVTWALEFDSMLTKLELTNRECSEYEQAVPHTCKTLWQVFTIESHAGEVQQVGINAKGLL